MSRIVTVLLNYNSDADLQLSVPQLYAQAGIDHSVVIVDNASTAECVRRTRHWLSQRFPDAIIGNVTEVKAWIDANPHVARINGRVYLALNHENRGYSAGNNVGLNIAEQLGATYIVIANPDVRLLSHDVIARLVRALRKHNIAAVIGPAIQDSFGNHQNPIYEPSPYEEAFFPIFKRIQRRTISQHVQEKLNSTHPTKVEKVHGSFFLARFADFQSIGFFDENVFLYCEEAILAKRLQQSGRELIFDPAVRVIHERGTKAKGNVDLYLKSRAYYLTNYCDLKTHEAILIKLTHTLIRLKNMFSTQLNTTPHEAKGQPH